VKLIVPSEQAAQNSPSRKEQHPVLLPKRLAKPQKKLIYHFNQLQPFIF
jgi:hypothetical protein